MVTDVVDAAAVDLCVVLIVDAVDIITVNVVVAFVVVIDVGFNDVVAAAEVVV